MRRLDVVMISKACVVGAYQSKLEELARFNDLKLTVIVPPYWREGKRKIRLDRAHTKGYQLIVARMRLNGHFHLHFYSGLGRILGRISPHILHIDEEPYNLATFQATWLAQRMGLRCLFYSWQNILRRYPFPFSLIERYNLTRAHYAIAGNQEGAQVLRAKGYAGPLAVIPQFGVDPQIFRPRPELKEGPFTIGYVGRLVEEKGVHILLEAVAELEREWRLRILGGGPLRPHFETLAQNLRMGDKVTFHPPLPSGDIPVFLNRLDALVLPSLTRQNWKEQFGRVLVEAMACGIPVVGSASGEIPNTIAGAGLIFEEGEVNELRGALRRLMEDGSLRQRLSELGRERVLAHYTQERIAEQTHRIYQEMAGYDEASAIL